MRKIYKGQWYGFLKGKSFREFVEVAHKNRDFYVVVTEKIIDLNKAMKGIGGVEKVYTLKYDEGGQMKLTESEGLYFKLMQDYYNLNK